MLLKIYALLLLLMPLLSFSQSDDWKLYINQKEVVSASGDSVQTIEVKHPTDTTLKFVFAANDTAFKKTVIIMNEQRNSIDSKNVTANAHETIFNALELYRQSNGKNINVYIVNIPADPAKAARVRMAPRLICKLQWTE